VNNLFDNCPNHANFDQRDYDSDSVGDACDVVERPAPLPDAAAGPDLEPAPQVEPSAIPSIVPASGLCGIGFVQMAALFAPMLFLAGRSRTTSTKWLRIQNGRVA
jgi:hypothetical protein